MGEVEKIKELRLKFFKTCTKRSADIEGFPYVFKETPAFTWQWIVDNAIKAEEEVKKECGCRIQTKGGNVEFCPKCFPTHMC